MGLAVGGLSTLTEKNRERNSQEFSFGRIGCKVTAGKPKEESERQAKILVWLEGDRSGVER